MTHDELRFVKSYPAFMEHSIWANDNLFKLYHYCLYKASRNCWRWHNRQIQPGEFPISKIGAAAELLWSKNKLLRCLDMLEQTGLISVLVFTQGTLIRLNDAPWLQFGKSSALESSNDNAQSPSHRGENQTAGSLVAPTGLHDGTACSSMMERNRCYGRPPQGSTMEPNLDNKVDSRDTTERNVSEGFERLWRAYPLNRRNRRDEAVILYQNAFRQGATVEAMTAALEADKRSIDWANEGGRYIPGIVKWLQREGWRDYIQTAQTDNSEEETLWETI